MSLIIRILVFTFFVSTNGFAASDQHQETKDIQLDQRAESSNETKSGADQDEQASANNIASDPDIRSPLDEKKTTNHGDKNQEEGSEYWPVFFGMHLKITDSLLSAFTLALVVIGAIQAGRLRETVDSFLIGERPYIFLADAKPDYFQPGATKTPQKIPSIEWTYRNYGRTPAIIIGRQAEMFLGKELPIKRVFSYGILSEGESIMGAESEKGGNISAPTTANFTRTISAEEEKALVMNKVSFFIFGFIKYKDIFNRTHTYNFGFKISQVRGNRSIVVAGGKEYNYTQTKKAKRGIHKILSSDS